MIDGLTARLCEALPDIIFLIDPGGSVRFCNRRAAGLLGRPAAAVTGRPLVEFVDGEPDPVREHLKRYARSGSPLPGALPLATPAGRVLLRARGAALRADDGEILIFLQCTEKRKASQLFVELNARLARLTEELHRRSRLHVRLQRALDEREVLVREVHHRVRNNLQVIMSFLSLQAREAGSEMARLALREAHARIRTLALIHGQLYARDNLGEVDFSELTPGLCSQLQSLYGLSSEQVRFEIDLPVWMVDLDQGVPLALLITEVVTNSLKHAFPAGRKGTVRIRLVQDGPTRLLHIADDGVGLPAGEAQMKRSLGMRLMRALADQIGGELELRGGDGVQVWITVPRE